jgi:hypothetical protein
VELRWCCNATQGITARRIDILLTARVNDC